ncbi:hypothetical protein AB4Z45_27830 [Paenibacillus sp. MCAF9]
MLIFEKAHQEAKVGLKEFMKHEEEQHDSCLLLKREVNDENRTKKTMNQMEVSLEHLMKQCCCMVAAKNK